MLTRIINGLFIFTAIILLAACASVPPPPKDYKLPRISLKDTAGKWYEIAAVPKYFSNCYCSYAIYTPTEDMVKASNYCKMDHVNGKERTTDVLFYPVKGSHNSRYVVKFNWLFSGDFWIIYINQEDKTAIVATPDKKHFWIISRTPTISQDSYEQMLVFLKDKNYPVAKIRLTDQSCWVKKKAT